MRPLHLRIENFGPYKGVHQIDFVSLGNRFIVYGPTGAGKTTIFDAMSFALFGELPGSRTNLKAEAFRSDHSSVTEKAGIEFWFSLGKQEYLIKRYLQWQRPAKRGNGTAEQPTSLEFAGKEADSGEWVNLTARKYTDTDRLIASRINITADEFWKIVVLPQGEFQKFLEADTDERKRILTKLFPVDIYEKVTLVAVEKAKEYTDRIRFSEDQLAKYRNEMTEETAREAIIEFENDEKLKQGSIDTETENLNRLSASLIAAVELKKLFSDLRQRTEELNRLESRKRSMESEQKRLDRAREASRVMPLLANENALLRKVERAEKDVEAAGMEKQRAIDNISVFEAEEAELGNLQKQQADLGTECGRLEHLANIAKEVADLEKNLPLAVLKCDTLQMDLERTTAKIIDKTALLDTLKVGSEEQKRLGEMNERLRKLQAEAVSIKEKFVQAGNLEQEMKGASEEKERCVRLLAPMPEALKKAEEKLRELQEKKEKSYAHELAEQLKENCPCPVCGSREHPQPATKNIAPFNGQEQIDSVSKEIDELHQKTTILEEKIRAAEETVLKLNDKREQTIGSLDELGAKSLDEAQGIVARSIEYEQEVLGLSGEIQNRQLLHERTNKELNQFTIQKEKTDELLKTAEKDRNELESGINVLKQQLKGCENALDRFITCKKKLDEVTAKIKLIQDTGNQLRSVLVKAEESLKNHGAALDMARADLKDGIEKLDDSLRQYTFTNREEVRKEFLADDEFSDLENAIGVFNRELNTAQTRQADLNKQLEGKDEPETSGIESEIAKVKERLAELRLQLGTINEKKGVIRGHLLKIEKALAERSKLEKESGLLVKLAKDLNGRNEVKKLSFLIFALRYYLQCVLVKANARLRILSDNRFQLKLHTELINSQSPFGLDLDIYDAFANSVRSVKTISGGEKFLASISLALGLSDEIQARAGGIRLESMFVDEGFGTLDNETKDRAIGILDTLGETRIVGVISHVEELKTRMPSRIVVEKAPGGSRIVVEN